MDHRRRGCHRPAASMLSWFTSEIAAIFLSMLVRTSIDVVVFALPICISWRPESAQVFEYALFVVPGHQSPVGSFEIIARPQSESIS